jgi:hypothetical protein
MSKSIVAHPADALDGAGLPIQPRVAVAVEHLEIGQRILADQHDVGLLAGHDGSGLVAEAQQFRAVQRGCLDDLERIEPGFLQQFEFADEPEARDAVDEPGVRSRGDPATGVLVVVHEAHPALEVVAPGDFVGGGPVEMIGAVQSRIRLEEPVQGRPGIGLVPLGIARGSQVAVGLVDRERRHERQVERDQFVPHRHPALRVRGRCLAPEPPGLGEAGLLVGMVVVGRIVLDGLPLEQCLGQPVPVLQAVEPQSRAGERVDLIDAGLVVVAGGADAEAGRLLDHRPCRLEGGAPQLHAIGATIEDQPHPAPRLGVIRNARAREHGIHPQARRGDLALVAALLVAERPGEAHGGADLADRGDPVAEPQLEHILRRGDRSGEALHRRAEVRVRIDEAGQRIHAGAVDHLRVPGRRLPVGRRDRLDPVAGDRDPHRAPRRAAAAIDQHDVVDHEAREGALAFAAGRRRTRQLDAERLGLFPGFLAGFGRLGDAVTQTATAETDDERGPAGQHPPRLPSPSTLY